MARGPTLARLGVRSGPLGGFSKVKKKKAEAIHIRYVFQIIFHEV